MKGRSALELGIYSDNGSPMLFKFRRPRWSLLMSYSIVRSLWVAVMQIGVVWTLRGAPVVFCSCGIEGWWRELKSMWVST
jgi:hypothetical protein